MSNENISNYLSELSKTVLEAKTFYEMWWVLRGDKRPQYVNILNEYNAYSRAMIVATFNTAIIALYKVTDKHSFNFETLFKVLPKDKFTDTEIADYQATMDKHAMVIHAVNILRNNVFGHNSKSLDHEASFAKADFVPFDCKAFLEDMVKMICDIYYKHENLVHDAFFKHKAPDELESILQTLMAHAANAE